MTGALIVGAVAVAVLLTVRSWRWRLIGLLCLAPLPVLAWLIQRSAGTPRDESDQTDTLHATSLFLQDSVYLTDRWILVAGARYLRYSQVAGRGRPFVANSDVADQKWLPRAGIVYKLAPELSLYGSYTQSLKPISRIAPLSGGTVSSSATAPEIGRAHV